MLKLTVFAATLLLCPALGFAQECLHGPKETEEDRQRREQAIRIAHQINAEQAAPIATSLTSRYKRLSELKISDVPNNFQLTMHLNGRTTYSFSLKDHSDPCYFAVFSDQDGFVYATHPEPDATREAPAPRR